jgi:hypothetical protein
MIRSYIRKFLSRCSQEQDAEAADQHRQARAAAMGDHGAQPVAVPPDQEAAKDGNKEPVGVVGVVPPLGHQAAEDRPVQAPQDNP